MFRTISTLCLTMLCGVVSMAQTQQLTLEKCRELALQNNKQILIGAEKVRAAGYQKKEALPLICRPLISMADISTTRRI